MVILSIILVAGCIQPTFVKPETPAEVVHFVKAGDSLSKIALHYTDDVNNYQIIAKYNGIQNVDLVYPGMAVRIEPHLLSPRYQHMATNTSMVSSPKSSASGTTDTNRTIMEGGALGAIIGGALGWFSCDKDDRKKCALVGAAAGGVLGGVAGNEVAKRKRAYATTEQYLDSEIVNAKELNRELEKNHKQQVRRLAMLEQEVDQLERDYRHKKASSSQLHAKRRQIRQDIDENTNLREAIMAELEVKKAAMEDHVATSGASDPRVLRLEQEIAQLQTNLDELQSSTQQLAQLDNRLSI